MTTVDGRITSRNSLSVVSSALNGTATITTDAAAMSSIDAARMPRDRRGNLRGVAVGDEHRSVRPQRLRQERTEVAVADDAERLAGSRAIEVMRVRSVLFSGGARGGI